MLRSSGCSELRLQERVWLLVLDALDQFAVSIGIYVEAKDHDHEDASREGAALFSR